MNTIKKIQAMIKVARPIHWTKNLSLFAALIFTRNLLSPSLLYTVFWAFIAFNLATSATYIFNDLRDVEQDRLHPLKKFRPLAAKTLTKHTAFLEIIVLVSLSFYISLQLLHPLFTLSVIGYLTIQVAYSLFLKNLPTVDILVIATGFIIRIYAGAFVIDAHLSVWFLLCVISVALFLASGKRRAELNIVEQTKGITRKSLTKYKRELLNSYVTMFGNAAWMSWALFSFFEPTPISEDVWLFLAELSKTTTISKLLMLTIPVVIFAIMRYQDLIFEGKSEAPEKLLLTDKPLVVSVGLWLALVIWTLYYASGAIIV